MTPQLRAQIQSLANECINDFTVKLMSTLNDAPLSALTGAGDDAPARAVRAVGAPRKVAASKGGRLAKRSSEEIDVVIADVVKALQDEPEGLSSEQLQKKLSLAKKEIQRPLILALERSDVRKVGEKRATRYFMPGVIKASTSAAAKPKRSVKPKKAKRIAAKKAAPKKKPAAKAAAPKKAKAAAKPRPSKKHKVHVEVVDHGKANSAPAATAST